jgi:hypothetical protein
MESCCICLEQPQPNNSLHLISCGCQGAWFHTDCQNMWLYNFQCKEQVRCPICRRDAPFKVTYDFSHPVIKLMKFLYVLELFLYYQTITPILQGTAVLAFPLLLPCSRDFLVFVSHYSIHSILDMFFISQKEQIFFRYLHLIILATYINHKKRVEPLLHFVEGRSIIYSKSIEYSAVASTASAVGSTASAVGSTAAQPTTNALEGDKPRRSGRRRR